MSYNQKAPPAEIVLLQYSHMSLNNTKALNKVHNPDAGTKPLISQKYRSNEDLSKRKEKHNIYP